MAITPLYTLRSAKGTPLTNDEVDGTFQYLKDAIDALEEGVFSNSGELAGLLGDETGSGKAVFNTNPVFVTGVYTTSLSFEVFNTTATTINAFGAATTINFGAPGCTTTFQGDVRATGDVVSAASSDIRLKTRVRPIEHALVRVAALRGVTWEWREEVKDAVKEMPKTGLIAQEVETVFPEVVTTREDGLKAIHYDRIIGLLVEAIKELNEKVERLENKGV